MNRRELLRELSRVQATWVNRNTPGTGDVDVTAEGEQDYLTRISAVFERAREDVRRKRKRAVTASAPAAQAAAAIQALLLAFNPNQPRDREGKWTDGGLGAPGAGVNLQAWQAQEASADLPVPTSDVFALGTAIAKIMSRDGTTVNDPVAFFEAATEALADSDITPRQYIAELDRSYGTTMAERVDAALRERGDIAVPAAVGAPAGPRLPDFDASYAERVAVMERLSGEVPRAADRLSGGSLADVTRFDWPDRSRTVMKRAVGPTGSGSDPITPEAQTDAEELVARVAAVLGVRAPAVRRVGPTEIELEYMPGRSGMEEYGAIAPKSITEDPANAKIGLLDYLTNNADRHTGNWTVDDDGNVYAIDHGLAFQKDIGILAYGPFALAHGFSIGDPKNVTLSQLDEIRDGLEGLRSNFRALGRGEWYDGMIRRLDDVMTRMEVR